ncbi:MAG: thioesterase family protein [Hyphomicrobium sp.]|jgi:acyl-CoA thioesterase FadM
MNLWLRLIWLLIAAPWRPRIALPDGTSVVHCRVLPLDLDLSAHMNNGRYLAVMDLGRLDLMLRGGLWRAVIKHKWTPVASAAVIRFRRELRIFERYRLESRIACWSEHSVVIEQTFQFVSGERQSQVAARALFKGGLYDRKAGQFVPIARLMAELGTNGTSPAPTPEIEAFLATDTAIRQATNQRHQSLA